MASDSADPTPVTVPPFSVLVPTSPLSAADAATVRARVEANTIIARFMVTLLNDLSEWQERELELTVPLIFCGQALAFGDYFVVSIVLLVLKAKLRSDGLRPNKKAETYRSRLLHTLSLVFFTIAAFEAR
ncbi:hypothetical protein [Methylorubrum extorquens]